GPLRQWVLVDWQGGTPPGSGGGWATRASGFAGDGVCWAGGGRVGLAGRRARVVGLLVLGVGRVVVACGGVGGGLTSYSVGVIGRLVCANGSWPRTCRARSGRAWANSRWQRRHVRMGGIGTCYGRIASVEHLRTGGLQHGRRGISRHV